MVLCLYSDTALHACRISLLAHICILKSGQFHQILYMTCLIKKPTRACVSVIKELIDLPSYRRPLLYSLLCSENFLTSVLAFDTLLVCSRPMAAGRIGNIDSGSYSAGIILFSRICVIAFHQRMAFCITHERVKALVRRVWTVFACSQVKPEIVVFWHSSLFS